MGETPGDHNQDPRDDRVEEVPFELGPGDHPPYENPERVRLPGADDLYEDPVGNTDVTPGAARPQRRNPPAPARPGGYAPTGASTHRGTGGMPASGPNGRRELLPGVDPSKVQEVVFAPEEVDPTDPDAVFLYGNDPEADAKFVRDRRSDIRRQLFSTGAQFVVGLIVAIISLGLVIMAITNPIWPYIVPAAIIAPIGAWFFRVRWRRWLGSAPYMYRLLTSLGEDAENVLVEHRRKQRAKYAKKVGTLYGDAYAEQAIAEEGGAPSGPSVAPDVPDDFLNRL